MSLEEARRTLEALRSQVPEAPGIVEREGHVLRLVNPEVRGALTVGMMLDLARHVADLQRDEALGVVVITGTPGAFCSGGHLGQVRAGLGEPEAGMRMCAAMTVVLDALATLPQLVVAAVDGPALGGGAELLTAADQRVLAPHARVGFVHARLGVSPGWGGLARLVRHVGPTAALGLLTSATARGPEGLGAFVDATGPLPASLDGHLAPVLDVDPAVVRALKGAVLAESPVVRSGEEARVFGRLWGAGLHRARLAR